MMMEEGPGRLRAAYRGNYDRLAAIKAKYDPDNLFHINQNILPTTAGLSLTEMTTIGASNCSNRR